jgi:hypothetical protein
MQTDTPHLHVRKNHGNYHIFWPSRIYKRLCSSDGITVTDLLLLAALHRFFAAAARIIIPTLD